MFYQPDIDFQIGNYFVLFSIEHILYLQFGIISKYFCQFLVHEHHIFPNTLHLFISSVNRPLPTKPYLIIDWWILLTTIIVQILFKIHGIVLLITIKHSLLIYVHLNY